jgi:hypothetical protein
LAQRLYFNSLRHELMGDYLEIGDNLGTLNTRRFGEARKTEALFGFL